LIFLTAIKTLYQEFGIGRKESEIRNINKDLIKNSHKTSVEFTFLLMITQKSFRGGRKTDEVRQYFMSMSNGGDDKICVCMFCNKRFSNASTLALKGHLAGNEFAKKFKTISCLVVPSDIKSYYYSHMITRKRSRTKSQIREDKLMKEYSNKRSVDCSVYEQSNIVQIEDEINNNKHQKTVGNDLSQSNDFINTKMNMNSEPNHHFFDSRAFNIINSDKHNHTMNHNYKDNHYYNLYGDCNNYQDNNNDPYKNDNNNNHNNNQDELEKHMLETFNEST
jgi:hypothetical protein